MEIQVRINSEGALSNQRYAFTNRYTLISVFHSATRHPQRMKRVSKIGRGVRHRCSTAKTANRLIRRLQRIGYRLPAVPV